MPLLPHFLQPLDEAAAKTVRQEKLRAAIGAGGNELELPGSVDAVVERYNSGEDTPHRPALEENVLSGDRH
jgi:hypothetical protein